jgi:hypothetical protein
MHRLETRFNGRPVLGSARSLGEGNAVQTAQNELTARTFPFEAETERE